MIVWDVIRGEGVRSALRRARERASEAMTRAPFERAEIVNVAYPGIAARTGGVAVQLAARLRAERELRHVALLQPYAPMTFEQALQRTGAQALHIEGTSAVPLDDVLRVMNAGVPVVISVHDFALFCGRPNLIEQPFGRFCFYSRDPVRCASCLGGFDHARHRQLARELLARARGLIFPSRFLLEQHRQLFDVPFDAEVIEPAVPSTPLRVHGDRYEIAFAGNVRAHKGGHLLPEIARGRRLHVFGGGDPEVLRALRRMPGVRVHGYYRAGTLASLLARHRVGLVLLPSIFAESHSIVMSEAWLAGAQVAAFDFGAPAERIREHGGGWLAPLESGAAGIAGIADRWSAQPSLLAPRIVQTPENAARAHIVAYRRWGILQS